MGTFRNWWSKYWAAVGIAFLSVAFFGGLIAFNAMNTYYKNHYEERILQDGYVTGTIRFGKEVNGVREGWWVEAYPRRPLKADYVDRIVLKTYRGTTEVGSRPRPKSIGEYRNGEKVGMWLHWSEKNRYGAYDGLLIDQELTGFYANGTKTGEFVPSEFKPTVENWEWPPLFDIANVPQSHRFFLTEFPLLEPFEPAYPDYDEVTVWEGERDPWYVIYPIPWHDIEKDREGSWRVGMQDPFQ